MLNLNLKSENDCQEAIKEYLSENVSEILADKINNGVKIEKDGKTLVNKKTLSEFWNYATKKAQELGTGYVKNETVFGWAIHYFEEESIIGTLYNEDGSEYKPAPPPMQKPVQRVPAPIVSQKPALKTPQQFTLFDIISQPEATKAETQVEEKIDEPVLETQENNEEEISLTVHEATHNNDETIPFNVDMETGEILSPQPEKPKGSSVYQTYMYFQNQYPHAVIAYRLGDFFEIFGENAIKVSNRLELTLTSRNCGLEERIPMVGFPYHAAEPYFQKISQYFELIIVEDNVATAYGYKDEKPDLYAPEEDEDIDDEDEFAEELAMQQFFDKEALLAIFELFDSNIDMQ